MLFYLDFGVNFNPDGFKDLWVFAVVIFIYDFGVIGEDFSPFRTNTSNKSVRQNKLRTQSKQKQTIMINR